MSIELKSDLTLLDPIRPFELSATSFDYSQTSRNPGHNCCYQTLTIVRPNTPISNVCSTQLRINHIIYGGWDGVFAEYDSHRKVSNSHFVGCEESE